MSQPQYGLRLFNDYGEEVVDFNAMMYLADSGVCRSANQLIGQYVPSGDVYSGGIAGFFFDNGEAGQYQTPCSHIVNNLLVPSWPADSLFFYRLTTIGLHRISDMLVDQPAYGYGMISELRMPLSAPNNLPYKVISSALPGTTPPEAHGLRMFDANGNLSFDSRYPAYAILDHLVISKADMEAVLFAGETRIYTLRQPVSDPFVHAPFFTSFRELSVQAGRDNFVYLPRLYQIDALHLGLERTEYRGSERRYTYSVSWVQDTVVMIGQ